MSDDEFWDIDQYLTTRRNQPIDHSHVVRSASPVHPARSISQRNPAEQEEVRQEGASPDDQHADNPSAPASSGKRERRRPRDIAEIHGIAVESLRPEVRAMIADLVEEIGLLHDEILLMESRLDQTETNERLDQSGQWLNRKGFETEVLHLVQVDREENGKSAIMVLVIPRYWKRRRDEGLASAEAMMDRVGKVLADHINAREEILARIGDDRFAVLLIGLSGQEARDTGLRLVEEAKIGADGAVDSAFADLEPDDDAVSVITRAEQSIGNAIDPQQGF